MASGTCGRREEVIVSVSDRDYEVEVVSRHTVPAPVAIVIPQHRTVDLTRLAVDAIRAFTPPALADIWVVDNASMMDGACEALGVNLILNRTPVWRRWQRPEQVGSLANAVALEIAVQVLGMDADAPEPEWMFAMHNDALPIKAGWLEWLASKVYDVVGTKASQRSGYPHSQGVLFGYDWLRYLGPGALLPNLPAYDVAEGPSRFATHWSAWGFTHSPERCRGRYCQVEASWLKDEACEISWDDAGDVFYVHFGGGSIDRRDVTGWIGRTRKAIGL